MSNGLAAAVILYFPDETVWERNIPSYLSYVQLLVVIDNTGADAGHRTGQALQALGPSIHYIVNQRNEGIGRALNQAAAIAMQEGYKWLLTMDQDSFFEKEQADRYFVFFRDRLAQANLAIIAPLHSGEKITGDPVCSDAVSVITSGSLINLDAWQQAGGYNENLFIDEVDHEYCYRVKEKGLDILRVNTVILNHQLGMQKQGAYLGAISRRSRTIHSPKRVYFMVRNYLFVRSKYRGLFPGEFKKRDNSLLVALKNNLFFSGNFMEAFKSIMRGIRDFRKGNFSNPS